ncbi:MAG: hypothetical protein AAFR65_04400 [Pseudomonadota bacterium]
MNLIGSIVRGLIWAILITAVAGLVGAVAAVFGCEDGGCQAFVPFAELMMEPAPGLSGSVPTVAVLGGILFFGLFIVLTPRDPVSILAFVFAVLIGVLGFLLGLPRSALVEPALDPIVEPEVIPEEVLPAVDPVPDMPPEPVCAAGEFYDGVACTPCEKTTLEQAKASLSFEAIETRAYWTYARAGMVNVDGQNVSTTSFVADLAIDENLCDAPAVLVLGSASSDGERVRNEKRARDRANNLADAVRSACGEDANVMAMSLGQSEAEVDAAVDRSVTIVKLNPLGGEALTPELLYSELGHALANGEPSSPLIERRPVFTKPWIGAKGEALSIEVKNRPMVRSTSLVSGAPASCQVGDLTELEVSEGLDQSSTIPQ